MKDAMTDHKAEWVERMLGACVPGGSYCDPQRVADAIREYYAVCAAAPAASEGEDGAVYQWGDGFRWYDLSQDEYRQIHASPGNFVKGDEVISPHMTRKLYATPTGAARGRDTERLDFYVENHHRVFRAGERWVAIAGADSLGHFATVREAIDAALAAVEVAATPKHDEGQDLFDAAYEAAHEGKQGQKGVCRYWWNAALATQPAARRVTAEDVEKSIAAYWSVFEAHGASTGADGAAMRAALESFAQPQSVPDEGNAGVPAEGVSGG